MDDTEQQRLISVLCTFILIVTYCSEVLSFVTIEEGRAATLQCPGFTPTPGRDAGAQFNWYKARQRNVSHDNRVAFLAMKDGVVNSERDLRGRATIDSTTGAMQITKTKVSDEHFYSCFFFFTSRGTIRNETLLTVTVTPSEQDLQVTADPPGPVQMGETVTFNCRVSRVRPPPRKMYWQFTDEPRDFGEYRNVTNSDNWTHSVSLQYSVSAFQFRRKLACHYKTSTRTFRSNELTLQILFKPSGKPTLKVNRKTVKAESKIDLTCDDSFVKGAATWFAWQFANGTGLANTTRATWTYSMKEDEDILQFICIAGNSLGQSNKSAPLMITVQNSGSQIMAIGTTIAVVIAVVGIAVAVSMCRFKKIRTGPFEPPVEEPTVHYDEIDPEGSAQPLQGRDSCYEKPISKSQACCYEPLSKSGTQAKADH